jgi:hypothetical protein
MKGLPCGKLVIVNIYALNNLWKRIKLWELSIKNIQVKNASGFYVGILIWLKAKTI